jgi:hypothetical protein
MSESSKSMKPAGLAILLFFAFFLALAGAYHVTGPQAEAGIRSGAQDTLSAWKENAPKLGERLHVKKSGWSYAWAFRTGKKGTPSEGTVFVLRITGNSGPYTGVFYRNKKGEASFCGLAGVRGRDAAKYGISPRVVTMWIARIERMNASGDSTK